MTIDKSRSKAIALFLSFCLLLLSMVSCQKSSNDLPFEVLNPEESSAGESLRLYRIVIPATCSASLLDAAKDLEARLEEQTGIPCEVVYDTESVIATEKTVELLLGKCDRPLARQMLSELRCDDYLCHATEDATVLGGITESATLAALEQYYDELFVYATAQALLPSSAGFSYHAEYPITSITLNGFELFEYTIVYDDTSNLDTLAKTLQASLHTDGGYALELCKANDFRFDRKQIYLKIDSSEAENGFRILSHEHGITLCAANLFGLSVALRHLSECLLTPTEGQSVRAVTETKETVPYPYHPLEIATLTLNEASSELSELITLNETVETKCPSMVFLGSMSDLQRNAMRKMLSVNYTAEETSDLLERGNSCRLLSDLSDQTSGTAKLYSIGTGDESFLLLRLDHIPTVDFSKYLTDRTTPLLILIDATLDSSPTQPPRISDDRFETVTFEISRETSKLQLFALYAEHGCFSPISTDTDGGYRSVTVHRSSAFYGSTE